MNLKHLGIIAGLLLTISCHAWYTTLNQADPYPFFTSQYPMSFLNTEKKQILKGLEPLGIKERLDFSIGLFGQKASSATNDKKEKCSLLDYNGRLNMVGLTYGAIPNGQIQPSLLTLAGSQPIKGLATPAGTEINANFNDADYSDPTYNLGFYTVNAKYNKIGVRLQASFKPIEDFVIEVQGGFAELTQTYTYEYFLDRTDLATATGAFPGQDMQSTPFAQNQQTVEQYFMDMRNEIFDQLGFNTTEWHKSGAEDFTISGIVRHNFVANKNADPEEWTSFTVTPFLQAGYTFGIAKSSDPDYLLSIPLGGNNKHNAFRLRGGFSLDFFNTIEVCSDACYSHFNSRTITTRVPTSEFQSLLFPYKTQVEVKPGPSWDFTIGFNAYQFLDKLSFYGIYIYAAHTKDSITLTTPDAAFLPEQLENLTEWKTQMFDIGFNYNLSPHTTFGIAFQLPVERRSAYKSYTSLLSMITTF